MAELIVVGFPGTHRAAEVLDELLDLHAESLIDLEDGVAVYRTDDGKLRVNQSVQTTTREGATWGGLLGAFVGALLATPLTAIAAVPAAAATALGLGATALGTVGGSVAGFDSAATWKDEFGISDEFVTDVGRMIRPGNSAVFVLARAIDPVTVAEQFRGYGGTVLRTTLSPERVKKLQQMLAAQTERRTP